MYNHTAIDRSQFNLVLSQLDVFIDDSRHQLSLLANVTALLKQLYPQANWIGFYFAYQQALHLGPFQGNSACTYITYDRGVCGAAARSLQPQLVGNVHDFPGHIACDANSLSEVVIPLVVNQELWGVLDLDAPTVNYFNQQDADFLVKVAEKLQAKLELVQ